jgi:hypothetical protein
MKVEWGMRHRNNNKNIKESKTKNQYTDQDLEVKEKRNPSSFFSQEVSSATAERRAVIISYFPYSIQL